MPAPAARASILEAIGNTPLVQLRKVTPAGGARVFVKLEYYNPTGSYKDRMALATVEGAERRGDLKPGMTVVGYTGGSTGSSLAMVCAVKRYRFTPVSSDAFAREKLETMQAMGSDVILVPSDQGKLTPDLFDRMKAALLREAEEPAGSPVLTSGNGGAHRVEGVGVGLRPPHLQAGTSTGLNVAAAVQMAAELGPEATVVTVACDSGLKYLAGDLYTG